MGKLNFVGVSSFFFIQDLIPDPGSGHSHKLKEFLHVRGVAILQHLLELLFCFLVGTFMEGRGKGLST
jgi:hypothetical protein